MRINNKCDAYLCRHQAPFHQDFIHCFYFYSGVIYLNIVVDHIDKSGVLAISMVSMNLSFSKLCLIILSFVICIPSVCGMFGMGLFLGGITFIEKRIGQFVFIIQMIILFASNVLYPTNSFISKILPFSLGIDIMRAIYLNRSITIWEVAVYLAVNAIWFIVGAVFMTELLKKQKKRGVMDNY